jgi:hypothetical protein
MFVNMGEKELTRTSDISSGKKRFSSSYINCLKLDDNSDMIIVGNNYILHSDNIRDLFLMIFPFSSFL